jgi:copper transport protein
VRPIAGEKEELIRRSLPRGARRTWLVALAATVAGLAAAPASLAHAVLVTTELANDAVVRRSPGQVSLRFNEPVETAFGAVRVYDSSARRVDAGAVRRPAPDTVTVAIDRTLGRGTYTVAWRVVSADSHPIQGAFVFHVKAPGTNPAGIAAQVLEGGAPTSVTALFTGIRFLDFALLLASVGGMASLALVLGSAHRRLKRRLYGLLAALAAALAAVALAGIVLQGAAAGGLGLGEALDWAVVSAVLETRFGRVWVVQAGLAIALAVVAYMLRRRSQDDGRLVDVGLLPAAGLVLTPALAGHASVSGPLSFVSDVVHVQAAAAWSGGLAFLVLALAWAREARWPLAAEAVPRFSTMAVISVAGLVVTGAVNGYLQVRAWRGLWETTYGLLLLAKVGLVLPILALGAYNRFAVPRLRRGLASALEQRRFLRMTGSELALMLAVVGVTAALVAQPPARAEVAPKGPFAAEAHTDAFLLNLVVDPAKAGRNEINLYLLDHSGAQADADEVNFSASLPSKDVGPIRLQATRAGPGHFLVPGAQLALAGDWQITAEVRRGEFELQTHTFSVPIREES